MQPNSYLPDITLGGSSRGGITLASGISVRTGLSDGSSHHNGASYLAVSSCQSPLMVASLHAEVNNQICMSLNGRLRIHCRLLRLWLLVDEVRHLERFVAPRSISRVKHQQRFGDQHRAFGGQNFTVSGQSFVRAEINER